MAESSEAVFGKTQTLAHLLEFLSRLDESESVKTKVIKKLRKDVQQYITSSLDEFVDEDSNSGLLPKTIESSNELRNGIVKEENTYRHYQNDFNEYIEDYTQHLIDNIFSLFGCFYYMYYECATECNGIKGGHWWDEKCDDTGRNKKHLNQWLTDQKGDHKHVIKRGFKDIPLSQKTGDDLFPSGSSTDALLYYREGAQLQFALYYMLFLPKDGTWNDAQSGHALLFLRDFCEKVKDGTFKDKYNDNGMAFNSACQEVSRNISELTALNMIVPVASSDTVKYKNLLDRKHFWSYITWLLKNLENLIKSLKEMANDASNWTETNLMTSKSFGPYPWGFTFRNHNWESKTGRINEPLSKLTKTLKTFKDALPSASKANSVSEKATEEPSVSTSSTNSAEKSSASTVSTTSTVFTTSTVSTTSTTSTAPTVPTASAASTLGGVAGGIGAAAATAGAAYSGVLGSAAEGVGRFFKGLFF